MLLDDNKFKKKSHINMKKCTNGTQRTSVSFTITGQWKRTWSKPQVSPRRFERAQEDSSAPRLGSLL